MSDLKHGKNVWRSCRHKKRYCTYNFAIKMALYYTKKFGKAQYVYWCPYCHGYHVTGVPPHNERERRIQEIELNKILKKKEDNNASTTSESL